MLNTPGEEILVIINILKMLLILWLVKNLQLYLVSTFPKMLRIAI